VFAAVTGFGNEPHLTTSFTAGVAMRINAYERFPESCMRVAATSRVIVIAIIHKTFSILIV
jgi:hypothetical protein